MTGHLTSLGLGFFLSFISIIPLIFQYVEFSVILLTNVDLRH